MKLQDCLLRFERKGRVAAVASIFRDLESLQAAVMMEGRRIKLGVAHAVPRRLMLCGANSGARKVSSETREPRSSEYTLPMPRCS
jgi:hypothetical protein